MKPGADTRKWGGGLYLVFSQNRVPDLIVHRNGSVFDF